MVVLTTLWANVQSKDIISASDRYSLLSSLSDRFCIVELDLPNGVYSKLIKTIRSSFSDFSLVYGMPVNDGTTRYFRPVAIFYPDGNQKNPVVGAIGCVRDLGLDGDTRRIEITIDLAYTDMHTWAKKRRYANNVQAHFTDRVSSYRETDTCNDALCFAASSVTKLNISGTDMYRGVSGFSNDDRILSVYSLLKRLQVDMVMTGTEYVLIRNGSYFMVHAFHSVVNWPTFWFNKSVKIPGNAGGSGFKHQGRDASVMHTHLSFSSDEQYLAGSAYSSLSGNNIYTTFLSLTDHDGQRKTDAQIFRRFYEMIYSGAKLSSNVWGSHKCPVGKVDRYLSKTNEFLCELGIDCLADVMEEIRVAVLTTYHRLRKQTFSNGSWSNAPVADLLFSSSGMFHEIATGPRSRTTTRFDYLNIRIADPLLAYRNQFKAPEELIQVYHINLEHLVADSLFCKIISDLGVVLAKKYAIIYKMYDAHLTYRSMIGDDTAGDETYAIR